MNIDNKYNLISQEQIDLLNQCSSGQFQFGGFTSIDDILTSLNVTVIIERGIQKREVPSSLNQAKSFWSAKIERQNQVREDEREDTLRKAHEANAEEERYISMPLRGLYNPNYNVIKLFPEEMQQEYNGQRMNELLVSTLIHETMHAYFNRPDHEDYPYVYFVEEPLAEFGMLLYLQETNSLYKDWAYNDVRNKRTCYKYGAYLLDQYLGGDESLRQYLERYKIRLSDYDMPSINRGNTIMPEPTQSQPIVDGNLIQSKWKQVFRVHPRYFWDENTQTLGLDGDWTEVYERRDIPSRVKFELNMYPGINIYLGDNFTVQGILPEDIWEMLRYNKIIVSSRNKELKVENGQLLNRNGQPI